MSRLPSDCSFIDLGLDAMGLPTTLFALLILTFVFSALGTPAPAGTITIDVYGVPLQVNHV